MQESGAEPRSGKGAAVPGITLISTRTCDVMTLPDGSTRRLPGGPAHYMGRAFERLGVPCDLITGELAHVTVLSTPHGEEYVIPALAEIPLPERLPSTTIMSPIVREINPHAVPPVDGLLIIDLQGFVREPGVSSGEVTARFELADLLARCDVVKAAEHELERLNDESRAALDGGILLTTLGERGALLRQRNREVYVPANPVRTPYTIGAGDTYVAAFAVALVRGCDPLEAAERAARFTEEVLRERM
jgi:hypothetical protein